MSSQPYNNAARPKQPPIQLNFPPPPTSASIKPTRKPKPIPFALNFNSNRRSSDSETSSINSITKPTQSKPILKNPIKSTKRTRQWILLFLLLSSFSILILSTILAYCAALPHSENASGNASSDLVIRDNTSNSEIHAALAVDKANQARFSTSQAKAALTFYTATLPILTMLHTGIELLISLVRPETSANSRLGDLVLGRGRTVSGMTMSTEEPKAVLLRRRVGTLLSFSVSVLLVLGWFVMQMFTVDCEIVTFGRGGEGVCPVQIRGHRMGGVSELSVGKVVLGFVVMVVYAGYALYLVRVVGVFGGKMGGERGIGGFRRRARFVSGEEVREGDDVERVGVELEGGKGRASV